MRTAANAERLDAAALLVAVGVALANLPAAVMPWPWLCAFVVPGALLGVSLRRAGGFWWKVASAAALQLGLGIAGRQLAGPLEQSAALAATILPPMAFVTCRRRQAHPELGLFLSFCVLLVGVILGGADWRLLSVYALAGGTTLRLSARLRLLATIAAPPVRIEPAGPLGGTLVLAAGCAAVVFLLTQALSLLPAPTRGPGKSAASQPSRRAGLDDAFELGGGNDGGLDLRGDKLVYVTAMPGSELPPDLYLRSGYFDVAALDAWRSSGARFETRDTANAPWELRAPIAGAPLSQLMITRLPGSRRNLVFVPPGTVSVQGLAGLRGDARREIFRTAEDASAEPYAVTCQELRWLVGDRECATPRPGESLVVLPPDLDTRLLQPLLDEWVPPNASVAQIAAAITDGLRRRCSYALEEPKGPYGHALLDFLFGPQRRGYCMHFASAMAVLLRMNHVPCRIGVGLFGGEPDGDRARVFGDHHAHAWVEIPYPGYGFVVFDPTPPAQRGGQLPATAPTALPPPAAAAPTPLPPAAERRPAFALLTEPWLWTGLLLLLAVASLAPARRRTVTTTPLDHRQRPARQLLLRILRELGQRGHPRAPGETLEQYLADLQRLDLAAPALGAAFAAYQRVRFGGRPFTAVEATSLRSGLAAAQAIPLRSV